MQSETNPFRYKNGSDQPPPIPTELIRDFEQLVKSVINNSKMTLFDKLGGIYSYLDQYNAFVSTFTVCQKGCAHCCQIGVNMGRLEAEYISYKGGPMLSEGRNSTTIKLGSKTPCPFLSDENTCLVYASRPFNCRTFHTIDDSKYCENGTEKHLVYGASSEGYKVAVYSELARWLKELHNGLNLPYRDIRDWFPAEQRK